MSILIFYALGKSRRNAFFPSNVESFVLYRVSRTFSSTMRNTFFVLFYALIDTLWERLVKTLYETLYFCSKIILFKRHDVCIEFIII